MSPFICLGNPNTIKCTSFSLINTLTGMKIDINRRTFAVANKTGGLSGPAIKPVAVRMVYQVAQAVNIPILGMGGIVNGDDAIEFISFLSNRQSGAVGLPNILIWAYYFWKNDVENGYYLKDPDTYLRQNFHHVDVLKDILL